MKKYTLFLLLFVPLIQPSFSKDYVWLIGGGPQLSNSQAQIEYNTKWIDGLLKKHKPDAIIQAYFTDGNNSNADVKVQLPVEENDKNMQPFARVFTSNNINTIKYYNHTVPDVIGGTEASYLQSELSNVFKKLKPEDTVMIIFQGHGGLNKTDTAKNHMKLWNNTHLSVIELDKLLQQLELDIPVRYFMPQCFSGGFSRLIYSNLNTGDKPLETLRCGFMAEYDFEESEGCTTSINEADYRDYSSYFFAALDGATRTQQPLTTDPDLNNDNTISLREAHFYSLTESISTDIPRSTSEVFLDNWMPWYSRWFSASKLSENEYLKLANRVALNNNFTLDKLGRIKNLKKTLRQYRTEKIQFEKDNKKFNEKIKIYQSRISKKILEKWPYLKLTHTLNYVKTINNSLNKIQQTIRQHEDYINLVNIQEVQKKVESKLLNTKRKITQIQKINHLVKLAKIYTLFMQRANLNEKAAYQRIVSCESLPF